MEGFSKHHRKPRSKGGDNSNENLVLVEHKKHRAYHLLFDNKDPKEVAQILNETWIDPTFKFICVKRKKNGNRRNRRSVPDTRNTSPG